ncbi:hypothetical protein [Aureimonas frigidaquae]|uniref:Glycosyltransferase family 1 protein n=1 Tax=Aureimonas frigidaquae TaxID=424757 RepID=A0A0P0Z0U8_9HYPH|nr:hypothetical protein [Aureimonas frigidaquae]BAT27627.1 hypothetical protein [Aureimonas frigidaquae]
MSTVYILTPVAKTGGIEAIFQLAHALESIGVTARLLPGELAMDSERHILANGPADFAQTYPEYGVTCVHQAHLLPQDSIVVPEVYIRFHGELRRLACRRYIWWLSLDNAFYGDLGAWRDHPFFAEGSARDFVHLYQSFYAAAFLHGRGVLQAHELKCYVNSLFSGGAGPAGVQERQPVILYNPRKDDVFWRILARQCPELRFQPLQGLSPDEMKQVFATSRVYIDFGSHPGMDRIPREAALNGLVVMTGLRGAAGNLVDVPIHRDFKFRDDEVESGHCAQALRHIVADYDAQVARQDGYRRWIAGQRQAFDLAVRTVWGGDGSAKCG